MMNRLVVVKFSSSASRSGNRSTSIINSGNTNLAMAGWFADGRTDDGRTVHSKNHREKILATAVSELTHFTWATLFTHIFYLRLNFIIVANQ